MVAGHDSTGIYFGRVYCLTLASLVAIRIAERLEGVDVAGNDIGPEMGDNALGGDTRRDLVRAISADHPSASRSAFSRALTIALKDRLDHVPEDA